MKRQKTLVAVISVVLFLAALLLGANTVFSVSRIEIAYGVSSAQAQKDSLALQHALEERYVGENIFFVKDEEVISAFDGYPYLSVTGFEKKYPDRLVLSVEEKPEVYAAAVEENGGTVYYMLSADGDILRKAQENVNNVDGGENFLLEGLTYSAENGFASDENFELVLSVCKQLDAMAGGVRTCLSSLRLEVGAVSTEMIVQTLEGVTLQIGNPATLTEEKITAGMEMYLSLDAQSKLIGYISVRDNRVDGGIITAYSRTGS